MIRNALAFILALAVYYVYLSRFSGSISLEHRLLVNFFLVPVSIGAVASLLMSGALINRVAVTALVPIVPIFLIGGDPAKSGMELVVIGPLIVMFAVGAAASGVLDLVIHKKDHSDE